MQRPVTDRRVKRRYRARPALSRYARAKAAADAFIHAPPVEFGLVGLILLSVGLMIGEYAWADHVRLVEALSVSGTVLTGVFVVELSTRFWVARNKQRFFARYWLDILAILPVIRPLRVLRVLRLLRLIRLGVLFNRRMSGRGGGLLGNASQLINVVAMTLTLVLGAAVVLSAYETSEFPAFDAALWFSVLSLVGGEPIGGNPESHVGRAITLTLMMGGLTVFGVFVGAVSAQMVSRLSKGLGVQEMTIDELRDHVVVLGWNGSAPTVLLELLGPWATQESPVVLVTDGERPPEDIPMDQLRVDQLYTLQGDYTRVDVLQQAGIVHASTAILVADTSKPRSDQDRDARTVLAALTVERLSPGIFTCAELTNRDNESLLRLAGVEEIVVGDWYAGVILGAACRNPGLIAVLDEVLTSAHGSAFHTAVLPPSLGDRTVAQLHELLLARHGATLISVETDGQVRVNPPPGDKVEAGARLVVLARTPVIW